MNLRLDPVLPFVARRGFTLNEAADELDILTEVRKGFGR